MIVTCFVSQKQDGNYFSCDLVRDREKVKEDAVKESAILTYNVTVKIVKLA